MVNSGDTKVTSQPSTSPPAGAGVGPARPAEVRTPAVPSSPSPPGRVPTGPRSRRSSDTGKGESTAAGQDPTVAPSRSTSSGGGSTGGGAPATGGATPSTSPASVCQSIGGGKYNCQVWRRRQVVHRVRHRSRRPRRGYQLLLLPGRTWAAARRTASGPTSGGPRRTTTAATPTSMSATSTSRAGTTTSRSGAAGLLRPYEALQAGRRRPALPPRTAGCPAHTTPGPRAPVRRTPPASARTASLNSVNQPRSSVSSARSPDAGVARPCRRAGRHAG